MVCLDTAVLIAAIRGSHPDAKDERHRRAHWYLRQLQTKRTRVAIPAPVMAEYFAGVPDQLHDEQADAFRRQFRVLSFDVRAAALAGRLEAAVAGSRAGCIEGVRTANDKAWLRIDAQIVSIASCAGVTEIITNNLDHFTRLRDALPPGQHRPAVLDIVVVAVQPGLFGDPPAITVTKGNDRSTTGR